MNPFAYTEITPLIAAPEVEIKSDTAKSRYVYDSFRTKLKVASALDLPAHRSLTCGIFSEANLYCIDVNVKMFC